LIAANNGTKQQILAALSTQTPSGSTNTAGGIDEAMRMIQLGLAADPGRMNKAFIILVTDGDPTCSGNGMNAMDDTIARIEAARQRGVKTFVIGMQGATAANLERMAVAGGAPCTTCTNSSGAPIKYYDATDPAKLAAELR
jgi:nitric oxide reductase activation protein